MVATDVRTPEFQPFVWAMGPLPPPVTGLALLTEGVVKGLKKIAPVRVSNFSAGDDRPRPHTRVLRVARALRCLWQLVKHGRETDGRLYLAANSKGGLWITGLVIKAAQRLGYTVYLHHHTYNYIDAFDKKMAWIDRTMRPHDVHVVHCPQMIDDFRARYGSKCEFAYVFPSIVSLPVGQPRREVPGVFRLGMLANLTHAKGLDLVLDTFRSLRSRGRSVELRLAGPCVNAEAQELIATAQREFPDGITHVGPVFGQQKIDFLHSIDAFVFPSRTESWGIVLNESLAAGVPVIASDRGCIRTLVGERAGVVVRNELDFVAEANGQIECWIDSLQDYLAASEAAIEQAEYLHHEAAQQLDFLSKRICLKENNSC